MERHRHGSEDSNAMRLVSGPSSGSTDALGLAPLSPSSRNLQVVIGFWHVEQPSAVTVGFGSWKHVVYSVDPG